jgi:hypothetical protein
MKKKNYEIKFEGMVVGTKFSAAMIHLVTSSADRSFMVPLETGEDFVPAIAKLAAHAVYLCDDTIPPCTKLVYNQHMKRISAEIREDLEKLGDLTQYVIEDPIDRKICEKFASH